jgi:metal-responsive CopG/Arc/MetJ family transcriptional regulator
VSKNVSLDPELVMQLQQWMLASGIESRNQAVNAILRMHLSATPETGAVRAAQERVLAESKKFLYERMMQFFRETQQMLEAAYK